MAPDHGSKVDISFAGRFTASAIAACFAEITTIPLDTAKVRLQLQKKAVAGDLAGPKYRGLLGTAATIAKEEGAAALWKGIVPGLHRQCIYGGLRIALYEPVKSFYVGENHVGDVPLSKKIAAGFTTGALAIAVANPTDLVKVRLQSEGKLAPGVPRRYTGAMDAYAKIVRQEGVASLWTGIGSNVARNAIINAAELASYDQVKQSILKLPGFKDDVVTHILSGLGAGFFAVCVDSPVDVIYAFLKCVHPWPPYANLLAWKLFYFPMELGCWSFFENKCIFHFWIIIKEATHQKYSKEAAASSMQYLSSFVVDGWREGERSL